MTLRIYADFNSVDGPICWCLRYGVTLEQLGRPLDELAEELQLRAGMPVTLYHIDELEEFEYSAVLELHEGTRPRWQARADWDTFKRIRR